MSTAARPSYFPFDVLRVGAAFAVVWLHVASYVVLYDAPNSPTWWIGNAADAAVRWCVPVFILISGALLLGPREETPKDFFRKRLNRVLIPLAFWTVFYIGIKLATGSVTPGEAAREILQGKPHYHMWYLYMALGLYVFTPFLRTFIRAASERERRLAVLLVLAVSVGGVAAAYFGGWQGTFLTLFVPYLGYYLLGYHLAQAQPRLPAWALWATLAACVAVTFAGSGLLVHGFGRDRGLYLYTYVGLPVILMSVAVYLLGMKLPPSPEAVRPAWRGAVAVLANASLGIYLIHPFFLEVLEEAFGLGLYCKAPLLSIPAVSVGAFAASAVAALVLLRIPYLKRIV